MKSEASIEIDRSIEEVFEITITRVADWSITVVEDNLIEQKPEWVGSRFHTVTEDRGKRMDFEGVVTHHDAPKEHAVNLVGKQFDIDAFYEFEDLGGKTRVNVRSEVCPKGFTKVMFALIGWMMKKAGCDAQRKELESLKRLAESEIPASS